ncbi:LOW QUALITY PROTEIN: testis-expressed protein 15 [Sminthopsis crassicaudata]|uniref:LOW QUALITY PROTEIN: testis-expressed protein 15 n=1 Tax=Sminthopsis crassicaudata TaxID=9301 RepID=UPI003D6863D6
MRHLVATTAYCSLGPEGNWTHGVSGILRARPPDETRQVNTGMENKESKRGKSSSHRSYSHHDAVAPGSSSGTEAHSLKNFTIPKIRKTPEKVYLTSCYTNRREYSSISHAISQCRLDLSCELQSAWQFGETKLIHNDYLEKKYSAKRMEMREQGRRGCELEEHYCFLAMSSNTASRMYQNGLCTRESTLRMLGNPLLGVYLFRHPDVALNYARFRKHHVDNLVIFKVLYGKVKRIQPMVDKSKTCLDPSPNFDCHMSRLVPTPREPVEQQAHSSAVYFYEYNTLSKPVDKPRQCLPYATLTLRFVGQKAESGQTITSLRFLSTGFPKWPEKRDSLNNCTIAKRIGKGKDATVIYEHFPKPAESSTQDSCSCNTEMNPLAPDTSSPCGNGQTNGFFPLGTTDGQPEHKLAENHNPSQAQATEANPPLSTSVDTTQNKNGDMLISFNYLEKFLSTLSASVALANSISSTTVTTSKLIKDPRLLRRGGSHDQANPETDSGENLPLENREENPDSYVNALLSLPTDAALSSGAIPSEPMALSQGSLCPEGLAYEAALKRIFFQNYDYGTLHEITLGNAKKDHHNSDCQVGLSYASKEVVPKCENQEYGDKQVHDSSQMNRILLPIKKQAKRKYISEINHNSVTQELQPADLKIVHERFRPPSPPEPLQAQQETRNKFIQNTQDMKNLTPDKENHSKQEKNKLSKKRYSYDSTHGESKSSLRDNYLPHEKHKTLNLSHQDSDNCKKPRKHGPAVLMQASSSSQEQEGKSNPKHGPFKSGNSYLPVNAEKSSKDCLEEWLKCERMYIDKYFSKPPKVAALKMGNMHLIPIDTKADASQQKELVQTKEKPNDLINFSFNAKVPHFKVIRDRSGKYPIVHGENKGKPMSAAVLHKDGRANSTLAEEVARNQDCPVFCDPMIENELNVYYKEQDDPERQRRQSSSVGKNKMENIYKDEKQVVYMNKNCRTVVSDERKIKNACKSEVLYSEKVSSTYSLAWKKRYVSTKTALVENQNTISPGNQRGILPSSESSNLPIPVSGTECGNNQKNLLEIAKAAQSPSFGAWGTNVFGEHEGDMDSGKPNEACEQPVINEDLKVLFPQDLNFNNEIEVESEQCEDSLLPQDTAIPENLSNEINSVYQLLESRIDWENLFGSSWKSSETSKSTLPQEGGSQHFLKESSCIYSRTQKNHRELVKPVVVPDLQIQITNIIQSEFTLSQEPLAAQEEVVMCATPEIAEAEMTDAWQELESMAGPSQFTCENTDFSGKDELGLQVCPEASELKRDLVLSPPSDSSVLKTIKCPLALSSQPAASSPPTTDGSTCSLAKPRDTQNKSPKAKDVESKNGKGKLPASLKDKVTPSKSIRYAEAYGVTRKTTRHQSFEQFSSLSEGRIKTFSQSERHIRNVLNALYSEASLCKSKRLSRKLDRAVLHLKKAHRRVYRSLQLITKVGEKRRNGPLPKSYEFIRNSLWECCDLEGYNFLTERRYYSRHYWQKRKDDKREEKRASGLEVVRSRPPAPHHQGYSNSSSSRDHQGVRRSLSIEGLSSEVSISHVNIPRITNSDRPHHSESRGAASSRSSLKDPRREAEHKKPDKQLKAFPPPHADGQRSLDFIILSTIHTEKRSERFSSDVSSREASSVVLSAPSPMERNVKFFNGLGGNNLSCFNSKPDLEGDGEIPSRANPDIFISILKSNTEQFFNVDVSKTDDLKLPRDFPQRCNGSEDVVGCSDSMAPYTNQERESVFLKFSGISVKNNETKWQTPHSETLSRSLPTHLQLSPSLQEQPREQLKEWPQDQLQEQPQKQLQEQPQKQLQEQPQKQLQEQPQEQLQKQLKEQPKEHPQEQPQMQLQEQLQEQPPEQPQKQLQEQSQEQLQEQPPEQLKEQPQEQPQMQLQEQLEQPQMQLQEQLQEQPPEQPKNQLQEQSQEQLQEQPPEPLKKQPQEQPQMQLQEQLQEQPPEQPKNQLQEQPQMQLQEQLEQPQIQLQEQLQEQPPEQPKNQLQEQPQKQLQEQSQEQLQEQPPEQLKEQPQEQPQMQLLPPEQPKNQPQEQPQMQLQEQLQEQPPEQPQKQLQKQSQEQLQEQPQEQPQMQLQEQLQEQPPEQPKNQLQEQPQMQLQEQLEQPQIQLQEQLQEQPPEQPKNQLQEQPQKQLQKQSQEQLQEQPQEQPQMQLQEQLQEQPPEQPKNQLQEQPQMQLQEQLEQPQIQLQEQLQEQPPEQPKNQLQEQPQIQLQEQLARATTRNSPRTSCKNSHMQLQEQLEQPQIQLQEQLQEQPPEQPKNQLQEQPQMQLQEQLEQPQIQLQEQLQEQPPEQPKNQLQEQPQIQLQEQLQEQPPEQPKNQLQEQPQMQLQEQLEQPQIQLQEQLQKQSPEQLKDQPLEQPKVQPPEQLKDQTLEQPKDQPPEQPKHQPQKQLQECLQEQPQEQLQEQPLEQPKDQPLEQPKEQPQEQPQKQLQEQSQEQLQEQPLEQPKDQLQEQPKKQLQEQPLEQPKDQPLEQPKEQPQEQPQTQLQEQLQEQPPEQLKEQWQDQPQEQPQKQLPEQLQDQLQEQPQKQLQEQPLEQLQEQPKEQLQEQSRELPQGQSQLQNDGEGALGTIGMPEPLAKKNSKENSVEVVLMKTSLENTKSSSSQKSLVKKNDRKRRLRPVEKEQWPEKIVKKPNVLTGPLEKWPIRIVSLSKKVRAWDRSLAVAAPCSKKARHQEGRVEDELALSSSALPAAETGDPVCRWKGAPQMSIMKMHSGIPEASPAQQPEEGHSSKDPTTLIVKLSRILQKADKAFTLKSLQEQTTRQTVLPLFIEAFERKQKCSFKHVLISRELLVEGNGWNNCRYCLYPQAVDSLVELRMMIETMQFIENKKGLLGSERIFHSFLWYGASLYGELLCGNQGCQQQSCLYPAFQDRLKYNAFSELQHYHGQLTKLLEEARKGNKSYYAVLKYKRQIEECEDIMKHCSNYFDFILSAPLTCGVNFGDNLEDLESLRKSALEPLSNRGHLPKIQSCPGKQDHLWIIMEMISSKIHFIKNSESVSMKISLYGLEHIFFDAAKSLVWKEKGPSVSKSNSPKMEEELLKFNQCAFKKFQQIYETLEADGQAEGVSQDWLEETLGNNLSKRKHCDYLMGEGLGKGSSRFSDSLFSLPDTCCVGEILDQAESADLKQLEELTVRCASHLETLKKCFQILQEAPVDRLLITEDNVLDVFEKHSHQVVILKPKAVEIYIEMVMLAETIHFLKNVKAKRLNKPRFRGMLWFDLSLLPELIENQGKNASFSLLKENAATCLWEAVEAAILELKDEAAVICEYPEGANSSYALQLLSRELTELSEIRTLLEQSNPPIATYVDLMPYTMSVNYGMTFSELEHNYNQFSELLQNLTLASQKDLGKMAHVMKVMKTIQYLKVSCAKMGSCNVSLFTCQMFSNSERACQQGMEKIRVIHKMKSRVVARKLEICYRESPSPLVLPHKDPAVSKKRPFTLALCESHHEQLESPDLPSLKKPKTDDLLATGEKTKEPKTPLQETREKTTDGGGPPDPIPPPCLSQTRPWSPSGPVLGFLGPSCLFLLQGPPKDSPPTAGGVAGKQESPVDMGRRSPPESLRKRSWSEGMLPGVPGLSPQTAKASLASLADALQAATLLAAANFPREASLRSAAQAEDSGFDSPDHEMLLDGAKSPQPPSTIPPDQVAVASQSGCSDPSEPLASPPPAPHQPAPPDQPAPASPGVCPFSQRQRPENMPGGCCNGSPQTTPQGSQAWAHSYHHFYPYHSWCVYHYCSGNGSSVTQTYQGITSCEEQPLPVAVALTPIYHVPANLLRCPGPEDPRSSSGGQALVPVQGLCFCTSHGPPFTAPPCAASQALLRVPCPCPPRPGSFPGVTCICASWQKGSFQNGH